MALLRFLMCVAHAETLDTMAAFCYISAILELASKHITARS